MVELPLICSAHLQILQNFGSTTSIEVSFDCGSIWLEVLLHYQRFLPNFVLKSAFLHSLVSPVFSQVLLQRPTYRSVYLDRRN